MSKFERISTFIMVIEQQSFAAAARAMQVSTAAVSRQIAVLEHELGVVLMERTTRKLALTEVGQEYYQQCKRALAELNEAEAGIAASKKEATGVLNIMASRYFAITYILPKLKEFMQLNPKLHINFKLAEQFPNFQKDNVDVLFGVSVEGSEDLVRKKVASTRYILCASPQYFKNYGKPQTPAELKNHLYITHMMRKPDNVVYFKGGKEIHVNVSLGLNDIYAMRECALLDMGIINVHDYMVQDAIADGSLVEILKEYQEPQINVYLYYQQSRYLQPKIRRFIDFYVQTPL